MMSALAYFHAFSLPNQHFERLAYVESSYATVPNVRAQSPHLSKEEPLSTSRPPILFVHFHKCGGTSVCETMRLFQRQVNITNALGRQDDHMTELNNCNTEFTHPHLIDRDFHSIQNCRMLEPYTMNESGETFRRNNFLAVEIPLEEPLPCPRFRSFALMREPVKRALSHLYYEHVPDITIVNWIKRKQLGSRRDFFMSGYPAINNLVTRQLLGRARYIDTRPIDDADYEKAKGQVDKFDAFVPLEHLRDEKVLTLLSKTVPEYYEGLMKNNRVANQQQPKMIGEYNETIIQQIVEENKYDTKLYQYMLGKLGIDSASHYEVPN